MWQAVLAVFKWVLRILPLLVTGFQAIGTTTVLVAGGIAALVAEISAFGSEISTFISRFCGYVDSSVNSMASSFAGNELYQVLAYFLDFHSLFYILSSVFAFFLSALSFLFVSLLNALIAFILYQVSARLLRKVNQAISNGFSK